MGLLRKGSEDVVIL